MENNQRYLNLGCGNHFHSKWDNIDFNSTNSTVKSYNLLKGIPYQDNNFDVVYHSHLLEHFQKSYAKNFLLECYRVLKFKGIIRIVIPDLERIAIEYLKQLDNAIIGIKNGKENYEWIMIELLDQLVRKESGGEMTKYLSQEEIVNFDYVYNRIGYEANIIRHSAKQISAKEPYCEVRKILDPKFLKKALKKNIFINFWRGKYFIFSRKFRSSGESHQWMYDRYSISELLKECGFKNIQIKSAFESNIKDWSNFNLDVLNGEVRKPDSLFVEAMKE